MMAERFTRWYVKRGWSFDGDGFDCPWYIKPLLFLFSPSIYVHAVMTKFSEGLYQAITSTGEQLEGGLHKIIEAVNQSAKVSEK